MKQSVHSGQHTYDPHTTTTPSIKNRKPGSRKAEGKGKRNTKWKCWWWLFEIHWAIYIATRKNAFYKYRSLVRVYTATKLHTTFCFPTRCIKYFLPACVDFFWNIGRWLRAASEVFSRFSCCEYSDEEYSLAPKSESTTTTNGHFLWMCSVAFYIHSSHSKSILLRKEEPLCICDFRLFFLNFNFSFKLHFCSAHSAASTHHQPASQSLSVQWAIIFNPILDFTQIFQVIDTYTATHRETKERRS